MSLRVALWVCYWVHRNAVDGLSVAKIHTVHGLCIYRSTSHAGVEIEIIPERTAMTYNLDIRCYKHNVSTV